VERFFPKGRFAPGDVTGIRNWLESRLDGISAPTQGAMLTALGEHATFANGPEDMLAQSCKHGTRHTSLHNADIDEFSRERQTGRLLDVLQALTAPRRGGRR
jgi:hypothetical protein